MTIDHFINRACTFLSEQELCDTLGITNKELCEVFYERIEDMIADNGISLEEVIDGE